MLHLPAFQPTASVTLNRMIVHAFNNSSSTAITITIIFGVEHIAKETANLSPLIYESALVQIEKTRYQYPIESENKAKLRPILHLDKE